MKKIAAVLTAIVFSTSAFAKDKALPPLPPIQLPPVLQAIHTLLHPNAGGPLTPAQQKMVDPLNTLQAFTVDDLNTALADAKANKDDVAAGCYTALIPLVQQAAATLQPPGKGGLFTGFQKLRDIQGNIGTVSQSITNGAINVACAPLVMSQIQTIIGIGALVGVKIGAGPITIPILP